MAGCECEDKEMREVLLRRVDVCPWCGAELTPPEEAAPLPAAEGDGAQ